MSSGASIENLLSSLGLGPTNTSPGQGGQGSPSMQGYGFNWYGGQPQTPEGGYYNRMAQAMAGPSYAPTGSNWYTGGAPQQYPGNGVSAPSYGGKGGMPQQSAPSVGGKGSTGATAPQQNIRPMRGPQLNRGAMLSPAQMNMMPVQ